MEQSHVVGANQSIKKRNSYLPELDNYDNRGRPPHLIDPYKKDKDWILRHFKAIYSDNVHDTNYGHESTEYQYYKYLEIVRYIQGKQGISRYEQRYDQNQSHTNNNAHLNLNKETLNLASKYFRQIYNKVQEVEFDVDLDPIDPLALNKRKEESFNLELAMELKQYLENRLEDVDELNEILGRDVSEIPENTIEKNIMIEMSLPMQMAMEVKMALEWINKKEKYLQEEAHACFDLVAFNKAYISVKKDSDGYPRREWVPAEDIIGGHSRKEDGSDRSEIGRFRFLTVNDIAQEAGRELTRNEIEEIIEKYANTYGNQSNHHYIVGHYDQDNYYDMRVLCADIYFYSWDEEYWCQKEDSKGNLKWYKLNNEEVEKKGADKIKNKNKVKDVQREANKVIYCGTWVVNTDILWNYGKMKDMELPFNPPLPIKEIEPLKRFGHSTSIMEEMIGILDQANLYWRKMQESLAASRPPGFELDIDSFISAYEGLRNQGYTMEGLMEMAIQRNIVFKSTQNISGMNNGYEPYRERPGGVGPEFKQYIEGLINCMNLLDNITGWSQAAAGNPGEYQGKGVTEIAMNAADYSIKHLIRAKQELHTAVMQSTVNYLVDAIQEGKAKGIKKALGAKSYEVIQINAEAGIHVYNLIAEHKPSAYEWQDLNKVLQLGLQQPLNEGGISTDQYFRIKEVSNLKQARYLLYHFNKQNKRKARQQQMEDIKMNGEQQRASNEQAHRHNMEKIQVEEAEKRKTQIAEEREERDTEEMKKRYDLEIAKLEGVIEDSNLNKKGQFDLANTQLKVGEDAKGNARLGGKSNEENIQPSKRVTQ